MNNRKQNFLNKELLETCKLYIKYIDQGLCFYFTKMKLLIEAGADINTLDENEETVLFLAVRNNKIDAVKGLLENGVDINIKNKDGLPALAYAIEKGNYDIIQILLDFNININKK